MARSPITLWLDDRDHHALATLHAHSKVSTLSETMSFAIHTLTQALVVVQFEIERHFDCLRFFHKPSWDLSLPISEPIISSSFVVKLLSFLRMSTTSPTTS